MEVENEDLNEIFVACRDGNWTPDIRVKVLQIQEGINIGDKNGVTALHVAAWNGHVRIV